MTVQEWLGENKLSLDIWNNKYRYNNESFDQWLDRVSGNNSEIKRLIKEKKFFRIFNYICFICINKFTKSTKYINTYK